MAQNRKKSELFSCEKKSFHKLFPRTSIAVLPTLETFFHHCPDNFKIFRKSSSFRDFYSENLLYKCSIGHVENFFDNSAEKFSCKNTGFSCQNPKKTKNQLFNSFFWRFYIRTLRLLFQHTWLSFLPKFEKTHWKSKRDDNSEEYFNHFFSKFCRGHVKWNLATCRNFLPKYGNFRSETKNHQRNTLLSKRASKHSAATVGCSLEKFDKKFTPKIQYFRSTTKNLEQSFFTPKKCLKNVPLNTLNGIFTILRVFFVWLFKLFCSKSENDLKKQFFHNFFSSNFFLY